MNRAILGGPLYGTKISHVPSLCMTCCFLVVDHVIEKQMYVTFVANGEAQLCTGESVW